MHNVKGQNYTVVLSRRRFLSCSSKISRCATDISSRPRLLPALSPAVGMLPPDEDEAVALAALNTFILSGAIFVGMPAMGFLNTFILSDAASLEGADVEEAEDVEPSVRGAGVASEDGEEDDAGPGSTGGEGLAFLDNAKASLTGAVSSRKRPTAGMVLSDGGGEPDDAAEASASARAICSAMSMRSRCSSDVTARSFFIFASYTQAGYGKGGGESMNVKY